MLELPDEWRKKYQEKKYYQVYDFIPPITSQNFLEKIPFPPGISKSIDILANLGRGFNVLEIALGMRRYYPDITPDEVLEILETFRARGYIRIVGVKSGVGILTIIRKLITCPICNGNVVISLDLTKLDFRRGVASVSIIHGEPRHGFVVYVDRNGNIRGVEPIKDIILLEE